MVMVDIERTQKRREPHRLPALGGTSQPLVAAARTAAPAQWGLALVLLLLAYEWLLSGLDKILNADFASGLAAQLTDALHNNPNHWYARFLNQAILPHAHVMAILVEVGEILVVLGLIAGAVWWLIGPQLRPGWARVLFLGACGALLGSAVMTANYYLLAGHTLPWLKVSDPFDEGLSIDGLMTLVALALLVIHLLARSSQRAGDRPAGDA